MNLEHTTKSFTYDGLNSFETQLLNIQIREYQNTFRLLADNKSITYDYALEKTVCLMEDLIGRPNEEAVEGSVIKFVSKAAIQLLDQLARYENSIAQLELFLRAISSVLYIVSQSALIIEIDTRIYKSVSKFLTTYRNTNYINANVVFSLREIRSCLRKIKDDKSHLVLESGNVFEFIFNVIRKTKFVNFEHAADEWYYKWEIIRKKYFILRRKRSESKEIENFYKELYKLSIEEFENVKRNNTTFRKFKSKMHKYGSTENIDTLLIGYLDLIQRLLKEFITQIKKYTKEITLFCNKIIETNVKKKLSFKAVEILYVINEEEIKNKFPLQPVTPTQLQFPLPLSKEKKQKQQNKFNARQQQHIVDNVNKLFTERLKINKNIYEGHKLLKDETIDIDKGLSSNHSGNEWINWLNKAIEEEHIKYYEYNQFNDIRKIGSGGFGKVYRANWKNTVLALKEYENIDIKEIINELNLQRKVDYHENIIRFLGITEVCNECVNKKYTIVMEYADGGSLKNYLQHNFDNLSWENKYQMAYQIAIALECLHNEGIVHRDLNSNNILIHQHKVKLADFGLSRKIEETSKATSKLFGVIPYIDPIRLGNKSSTEDLSQNFELNEKSDIYSLGVLFWEISSGLPPFKNTIYDLYLAIKITRGYRETDIEGTPLDYIELYRECWNGKLDNRPTIQQIVIKLKAIISKENIITDNNQINNYDGKNIITEKHTINLTSNTDNTNLLQGKSTQTIQDLDSMDLTGYTYSNLSCRS